eukprot:scaffold121229_cov60-Attheya_sp.AAC.1
MSYASQHDHCDCMDQAGLGRHFSLLCDFNISLLALSHWRGNQPSRICYYPLSSCALIKSIGILHSSPTALRLHDSQPFRDQLGHTVHILEATTMAHLKYLYVILPAPHSSRVLHNAGDTIEIGPQGRICGKQESGRSPTRLCYLTLQLIILGSHIAGFRFTGFLQVRLQATGADDWGLKI